MTTPKHAGGRPTKYTKALAAEICSRLAAGESLRSICKNPYFPSRETVFQWMFRESSFRDEFHDQYARARRIQAESHAEEMAEIADDDSLDMAFTEDGKPFIDREHIQRSKLRVETRRWNAERLLPKVYGVRQEIEHSGRIDFASLTDQELEAIAAGQGET